MNLKFICTLICIKEQILLLFRDKVLHMYLT